MKLKGYHLHNRNGDCHNKLGKRVLVCDQCLPMFKRYVAKISCTIISDERTNGDCFLCPLRSGVLVVSKELEWN
jgi:hypothetical protein